MIFGLSIRTGLFVTILVGVLCIVATSATAGPVRPDLGEQDVAMTAMNTTVPDNRRSTTPTIERSAQERALCELRCDADAEDGLQLCVATIERLAPTPSLTSVTLKPEVCETASTQGALQCRTLCSMPDNAETDVRTEIVPTTD